MPSMYVDVRSHHFAVTNMSREAMYEMNSFLKGLKQWGFIRLPNGKCIREVIRVFAAYTNDKREFRIPISLLPKFESHFQNSLASDYVINKTPEYSPVPVILKMKSHWVLRENQNEVVSYLTIPGHPISKFINLQTGFGKSVIAMAAAAIKGHRTVIIVRPMYIEKWQEDILRTYDIDEDRIMTVRGGAQLMALIAAGQSGDVDADIIIISNKTLQSWIKQYHEFHTDSMSLGYDCLPQDFLQVIGAGTLIKDEVHQDFHLNTILDCYTNVPYSISLSATLVSDDEFINKMYEVVYPAEDRYKGAVYKQYISAKALMYNVEWINKIRTKEFNQPAYSHIAYEKSIVRNRMIYENYLRLIRWSVKYCYAEHETFKKGDKCLVFCASIDMCTRVAQYLASQYPKHIVKRYVEDDPYENLNTADIIVSTVLSAGTAVDIPNLTSVILTVALKSSQSNIQGFGRLRELKDGRTPEFWYFVCENIPKHMEYHQRKKVLLEQKAKEYRIIRYNGGSI